MSVATAIACRSFALATVAMLDLYARLCDELRRDVLDGTVSVEGIEAWRPRSRRDGAC
jgi:hypothetical protein